MAYRVLLVDDEPSTIKLVSARLESQGFEVMTAIDGRNALTKARQEHPDLIILDLMLPNLNGFEVCTLLKQDDRYRNIPIILFTTKSQNHDIELGRACGADAYITKPFNAQVLLDTMHKLLDSD